MASIEPFLLTVDDDAAVSRAVARDLRRRYGENYRVVRATSGAEALDALRELKLRGDRVAAILADYRMPQMDGVAFLEAAMDVFPRARRALLTAYADTDAAIRAINVVDVDHYLLKPWDPPEEKLYPVVDSLLDLWREAGDESVPETKVIGHRWSAKSHKMRDFLVLNSVPYRWYSVDEEEGQRLLQAAGMTDTDVPVVVCPDGAALASPTRADVASHVGLSVTAAEEFYDLVIVGGGPAGLGAAVYGASEGINTILVERQATGGQAGRSSRIENYLGFPDGVSGGQLTERARRQAAKFGAEVLTTRNVTGIEAVGPKRVVHFDDGTKLGAHCLILATGVSWRMHPADGAEQLTGRGVFYGSTGAEAAACKGQQVYIVGGANSAGQAALFLAGHGARVTILVRGKGLEQSMSYYLIQQIREVEAIDVRTGTEVVSCHGEEQLTHLCLRDVSSGEEEHVPTQWMFVFIGAAPQTDWLGDAVVRDRSGFVVTGPDLLADGARPTTWTPQRDPYYLESSVPGVFAAGDVRSQSVKRVASAVGEGAMAVTLVHRYLEGS